MTELTTITRPPPPASTPISVPVSNDELNYPHLRLLNRQSRVTLSPVPFQLDSPIPPRLFAVANTLGWFAAVIKKDDAFRLICSPLGDLRTAAMKGNEDLFAPYKSMSLGTAVPCALAFAASETRLVLGLTSGEILLYDATQLCTPGQTDIQPIHVFQQASGSTPCHILPNPNITDPSLSCLIAVVPTDGRVLIFNVQTSILEGGWNPGDMNAKPVTAAWSPKGKQLAIGLQTGEILTFSLADKSKPHKIISSTAPLPLSSLSWLAPGHTFQTTFASSDDPQYHIVTLDTATSSVNCIGLSYPFPLPERPQRGFTVFLPNWDFGQGEGSKSLVLFGDVCSTDIELLGHVGSKWDQKSRDDAAITIPLDKNSEDTFLLGLDVDLTSTTPAPSVLASGESAEWPAAPILYAYLNDGTLQAWHITQATPYAGMVIPSPTASVSSPSTTLDTSNISDMAPEQEMLTPAQLTNSKMEAPASSRMNSEDSNPPSSVSGFTFRGQVSNPSSTASEILNASASNPQASPHTESSFGHSSAFGRQTPSSQSVFGQGSFGQGNTFGGAPSAGGFASFASASTPKFGQSAFGFASGSTPPPIVTKTSSSESMSDDMQAETTTEKPEPEPPLSFGGLSLDQASSEGGNSKPPVNNMFGSATDTSTAAFGGSLIKPASGFGAFSNLGTNLLKVSETPPSLFSSTSTSASTSPAFGQASFGQSSFGQSSFGKSTFGTPPTFGSSVFGKPPAPISATTAAPSNGGFASFAQSNVAFGKPNAPGSSSSSPATSSVFGDPNKMQPTPVASVFSPANSFSKPSASPILPLETPSRSAVPSSPSSSPDSTSATPPSKPLGQPVFSTPSQGQTSSIFKPASGFGAFGSTSTPASSPFFNPATSPASKSALTTEPAAPKFGASGFGITTGPGGSGTPKFGMPSTFGAKPPPAAVPLGAGLPPKVPPSAVGGFTSFSGGTSAFGAFAGPQKSFKDLLSSPGDTPIRDKAESTPIKTEAKDVPKETLSSRTIPGSPPKSNAIPLTPPADGASPMDPAGSSRPPSVSEKQNDQKVTSPLDGQSSLSSISFSSAASSFVEVSSPGHDSSADLESAALSTTHDDDAEDDGDNDDEGSFISESFSSDASSEDHDEQSADESLPSGEEEEEEEGSSQDPVADSAPADLGLRSPSATPTAETPSMTLSKSPTPTPTLTLHLDTSTTPPGSPEKLPSPFLQDPLPAPTPTFTFGTSSPSSGLSAGRPSTRPTRSSPLAKTPPLSGEPERLNEDPVAEEDPVKPRTPPIQHKPRPASPKGPFGVPSKSQLQTDGGFGSTSRPKTPPLLSSFGFANLPNSNPPDPGPPDSTAPPTRLPGPSFSFPAAPQTPHPDLNLSQANPPPSIFGRAHMATPPPPPLSPFFTPPPRGTAIPAAKTLFGGRPVQVVPPVQNPPPPPPQPTLEECVQTECGYLFSALGKELEDLKGLAQVARRQSEELGKGSGVHGKTDLRRPETWGGLNDATHFGRTMKMLESDVKHLKQIVADEKDSIGDIQGSMLKAATRKEEIARFNRAKNDAEFSQMLKSRTLGPEHHETQVQLRKSIRDIRDRVTKLEQHLQTSKSKLSRSTKGKPTLKAPSLVTAHRTLKNIDIAIHQQATEIAGLSSRLARLDISSLQSSASLSSRSHYGTKRHYNATPNVAVTTAAALNAERSTHRLKDRLLMTRKEPLLNNRAAPPNKAPMVFSTPRAAASIVTSGTTPSLDFTPPPAGEIEFSPSPSFSPTPTSRRGAAFTSKHYKSATLKAKLASSPDQPSSPATPSAFAPPTGFSWGPMPSFPPIKTLAAPIIKSPGTP